MGTSAVSIRHRSPLIGVLVAAVLFVLATTRYPGGYDWLDQSVSSLFQPIALNGLPNSARTVGSLAVVAFCLSMAIVFDTISRNGPSKFHGKAIQIGGVGSMVYAALAVTPMHDLVISVALVFFVVAIATFIHQLHLERRVGMLSAGLVCLGLTLSNATIYYGDLFYGFLPIVQKLSLVGWAGWLLAAARRYA